VIGADAAATPNWPSIIAAARTGEPDRYLAALLAPRTIRADLVTLAAFAAEIGRVAFATKAEPLMGELRLQWWYERLQETDMNARSGHPVADAVLAVVDKHRLPREWLLDLIEAAFIEVSPRPFADDAALAAHLANMHGPLFRLAGRMLGATGGAEWEAACAASAQAYGLARLVYELPRRLAHGRLPVSLPRLSAAGLTPEAVLAGADLGALAPVCGHMCVDARAHLAAARHHVANLPRKDRVVFLPLALVDHYLQATVGPDGVLGLERRAVAPLARIGRILLAHWRGRP
jgi:15-cis-phytoene synthase